MWLASIRVMVSGRAGSCEIWFSRITSSSSSGSPKNAVSSMELILLAVKSILFSLSEKRWKRKKTQKIDHRVGHLHSDKEHTHEGEVRLVNLGDSVVTGVEVSGVFGDRWNTIQLQVVTVDRTSKACAQQASGHTWSTWARGRR